MQDAPEQSPGFIGPINALPVVVVALFLAIIGIEITFLLAEKGFVGGTRGIGWRVQAVQNYAFSPLVWEEVAYNGNRDPNLLQRFVSYPFIHRSFTHAAFAAVLLLALGKYVGELFHWASLIVLLVLTTLIGAVAFGLWHDGRIALVGSYPAVYGLIGCYTYIIWLQLGKTGKNQYLAFQLIGILLGLQLFFSLVFDPDPTWVAEVAGFFTGLFVAPLLAPGGLRALLARARRD